MRFKRGRWVRCSVVEGRGPSVLVTLWAETIDFYNNRSHLGRESASGFVSDHDRLVRPACEIV